MHIRVLPATLAIVAIIAAGCDDGTQEQSPGEVLARDSVLASGLMQADTSSFAEAADPMTPTPPMPPTPLRRRSIPGHADSAPRAARLRARSTPKISTHERSRGSSGTDSAMRVRAVEILQQVPGAALPSPTVRRRGSGAP